MVLQEEDDVETDEKPLQCKRKWTETDKDQLEPKRITTEAETCNTHSPKDNVTNTQA
ncbi:hypothetical protein A2U01_0086357, partial [Trifolium medium]|nr:hypothetical protein [Trifolium medium]